MFVRQGSYSIPQVFKLNIETVLKKHFNKMFVVAFSGSTTT